MIKLVLTMSNCIDKYGALSRHLESDLAITESLFLRSDAMTESPIKIICSGLEVNGMIVSVSVQSSTINCFMLFVYCKTLAAAAHVQMMTSKGASCNM